MIQHLLSAIVFLPLLGGFFILLLPSSFGGSRKDEQRIHRAIAILTSTITFIFSCLLVAKFNAANAGIQFLEQHDWISSLRISYILGVDGLSVAMIPLTSLLFLLGILSSEKIAQGVRGYFSLFLLLETATLGTFAAQDLFLFFSFWEASLLPIYFMIGVWGNRNREYAATKFFLYQLAGSAFLLLGMMAIYYVAEPHSFSLLDLAGGKFANARIDIGDRSLSVENLVFLFMLAGFAVRLPIVPFHSWFPHVQAEAPSALAVVLAAVFIKTGAYAILRFNYALFPNAASHVAYGLAIAGTVNIIYGGICALGQTDLRRLGAYLTISHMGFVLLGLGIFSSTSFHGAILQMVSHAIYCGLFFFLVGILGARSGEYQIIKADGTSGYGGLISKVPVMTGFFTVAVFSALGVPGLGSFPAQSLVFLGSFPSHHALTTIGLIGVFLTAGYLLWMYRRVFLGALAGSSNDIVDVTSKEQIFLVPLIVLCLFVGSYPTPLISLAQPTIDQMLVNLNKEAK